MQDASQQPPTTKLSPGYRPLIPADLTRGVGGSTYGYVAGAAALGLLMGMAVAMVAGNGNAAAASRVAEVSATHTSGMAMLPASYTGAVPTLLSQVEARSSSRHAQAPVKRAHPLLAAAHKRRAKRRLADLKKSGRRHHAAKRRDYVSPKPVAPVEEKTALELATAAAATGPFFLGIQGDVTVANYDAATGTIQTYEGETYQLARNGADGNAIPWQDYPFNVHFRCDETGQCTLSRGGASASAKLTE